MLPWLYILHRGVSGEHTIVFLVQIKVGMDILNLVYTYSKVPPPPQAGGNIYSTSILR